MRITRSDRGGAAAGVAGRAADPMALHRKKLDSLNVWKPGNSNQRVGACWSAALERLRSSLRMLRSWERGVGQLHESRRGSDCRSAEEFRMPETPACGILPHS